MLGMGKNTVEIIIAAKDRTSAAFAKVNTQMKTMGGTTGRLKSSMGSLTGKMSALVSSINPVMIAAGAAAIALATMGGAAIKASLEFEKAVATIRVGTGATGEALAGLEGSFKTVFTAVPTTTAAAATAIADLNTRLGLTGKPLEALATQFLNLSRITGTDVAASISSATRVMHDFAVSSEDQAGALDYLFKVSQSTGIGMTNLANNMTRYGGVMRQMGFDINTSAALLGKFEKEGVNLELVLSSLRMGLANFARAGEEPVEALKRVITEIQGMGSAADRNLKAIEIFGARSGPDMAAAIYEGRFSIEELMATLDASSETINKAAADALTFGDTWTLFKNKIMTAIEPIGDVILNVLGGAMNTAMAAFDLASENIKKFKAAIAPLTNLIGDLFNKLSGGRGIFQIYIDYLTILWAGVKLWGDVIIWLVKHAIILLVNHIRETIKELTNLYNKLGPLKDLIGFVKGAVDKGVGGFHNYAESFREVEKEADNLMDRLDATIEKLEGVKNKAAEVPVAIIKEWKKAGDAFEAGTGSMKDAIDGLDAEIEKLKEAWFHANEEERAVIEEWVATHEKQKEALIEQGKIRDEIFAKNKEGLEEAIETQKEFIVTIGDTTIEFKGAAAEVLKNADAYEKLQKSAKTFTELDWSVFRDFEAALPNINAGIGDMESSFVGLKGVLEDNIDKLEEVEQAVMDISEIAAPFLEKGFLEGIKAIGKFAGALKDAGSAINTFAGLQDVSIEGCIKFSMHVRDMVTALEILESQMVDLEPLFGSLNSLIGDLTENFVYSGDKIGTFTSNFSDFITGQVSDLNDLGIGYAETTAPMEKFFEFIEEKGFAQLPEALGLAEMTNSLKYATQDFSDMDEIYRNMIAKGSFSWLSYSEEENAVRLYTKEVHNAADAVKVWEYATTMSSVRGDKSALITSEGTFQIKEYTCALGRNIQENQRWIESNYGVTVSTEEMYAVMQKPHEEQQKWFEEMLRSGPAITHQWNKQTAAIEANGKKLKQLTDAMQPQLEFMRTLNELAALSTLSVDDLNSGLEAITNTLSNLGTALSTFDLRPVMESLFGYEITEGADIGKLTGGAAKGFMDVMADYEWQFAILEGQILRFTSAILNLVNAFEALTNISDSVLANQTKLKEVFEGVTGVMTNFSTEMGGTEGFAQKFAEGMDAMLKSAEPLMKYFQDNKEAIMLFNSSLRDFGATVTNIVNVFEDLASAVKRSSELVVISSEDMEAALGLIPAQLGEIAVFLGGDIWGDIVNGLSAVDFSWKTYAKTVDDSMPAFTSAMDTFTTLISKILGLSSALKDMRDMTVLSVRDIDEALKNIPIFLDRFVDALALNMGAIKRSLKELHIEWEKHADEMKGTMPSYEASTDAIGKLIGSLLSLGSALKSLAETGTITEREFDVGFKSLMTSISNFAVSLSNNVDALIYSLQKLRVVWMANEDVLFPLIRDFAIITDNLWGVAHNANRMAEEFNTLSKNSGTLKEGFKSLIEFINQVVESTKEFYTPEAAAELARFIEDVGDVIDAFVGLERDINTAMGKIKKAIGTAVDNIAGKISSLSTLSTSSFWWGVNMMKSFIAGIYAMSPALALAVAVQAAIVQAFLGAASPTKSGPLSHLDEWPRNLIQSYSAGIEAEMNTLNSSFAGMVAGPAVMSGGGGNKNINLYVTQNIGSKEDADYATQGMERMLQRHAIM